MTKANIILEYLQQIGAKKETDMYLKAFRSVEPRRFAVITVDAQTLAVSGRDVSSSLAYLSSLGLTPIVVHNATGALGRQLVSDIWKDGGKCQSIMAPVFTGNVKDVARAISEKAAGLISVHTMPIVEV
jgi:hypothetical protein